MLRPRSPRPGSRAACWSGPAWPAPRSCRSARARRRLGRFGARRFGSPVRRQEAASSPATWRTWLLTSPDELRPAQPAAPTTEEIEEIVGVQAAPTEEQTAAIAQWGGGAAALLAWSAMLADLNAEFKGSGVRFGRSMGLLHTAMADAVVAAWDAQDAYDRPSPAAADSRITAARRGRSRPILLPLRRGRRRRGGRHGPRRPLPRRGARPLRRPGPDGGDGAGLGRRRLPQRRRGRAGARPGGRGEGGRARRGRRVRPTPSTRPRSRPAPATGSRRRRPSPRCRSSRWAEPGKPGCWPRATQFRPAPPPEYQSPLWEAEMAQVQEVVARRTLQEKSEAIWWQTTTPQPFLAGRTT